MVSTWDMSKAGRNSPHAVAVRSVGVSMQMTQVRLDRRGGASAPCCDSCWDLTCSARCFCSAEASGASSSSKSICSILSSSVLLVSSWWALPRRLLVLPSFRLARFVDGPAFSGESVLSRLGRLVGGMVDGESGDEGVVAVESWW